MTMPTQNNNEPTDNEHETKELGRDPQHQNIYFLQRQCAELWVSSNPLKLSTPLSNFIDNLYRKFRSVWIHVTYCHFF